MRKLRLENMVKGWFIGNITPAAVNTGACEVAVKHYAPGTHDPHHHHKIATEVTVIVTGEVEMNGARYHTGDIIVIEPHESTDFKVLSPTTTVVVKLPGANDDKYLD